LPEFAESEGVGLKSAVKKYTRRLLILIVAVTVQLITYNMAAYYVPYAPGFSFGEEAAPLIVAVSNLGASAGAIPFLFLVDRSRKAALLSSFCSWDRYIGDFHFDLQFSSSLRGIALHEYDFL